MEKKKSGQGVSTLECHCQKKVGFAGREKIGERERPGAYGDQKREREEGIQCRIRARPKKKKEHLKEEKN